MFTKSFLQGMRMKALRRGVWFKTLDTVERGILNLTSILVDRVESEILGLELLKIVRKLREAMKGAFVRRLEKYGLPRALSVARRAQSWGHPAAGSWVRDLALARYLTMMDLNKPSGFGV